MCPDRGSVGSVRRGRRKNDDGGSKQRDGRSDVVPQRGPEAVDDDAPCDGAGDEDAAAVGGFVVPGRLSRRPTSCVHLVPLWSHFVGWVNVSEPGYTCPTSTGCILPFRVDSAAVGIGSKWECSRCGAVHKLAVYGIGIGGDKWRMVSSGTHPPVHPPHRRSRLVVGVWVVVGLLGALSIALTIAAQSFNYGR